MRLHEDVEPEPARDTEIILELMTFQTGRDQEQSIGAGGARLVDLIFVDDEILAQKRKLHNIFDVVQIFKPSLKILLLRQDRDTGRAGSFIGFGDLYGIEVLADDAF